MLRIVQMSEEDFSFAVQLTDTVNWQLVEEDFQFALQLEPEGCFVVHDDSKRIGLLTTISLDTIGWIGNVIVDKSYRKTGAGSKLVKHAIVYLKNKKVKTIGLYAYLDVIPFYEKLGFTYDSDFTVLQGSGRSSTENPESREQARGELDGISDLDTSCLGASRRKLLEIILLNKSNLCYAYSEDTGMIGYAAAKVYNQVAEIGPLVCRRGRSDIAINLLQTIFDKLSNFDLSTCVPKRETSLINFLLKSGFTESFRVARMFLGTPVVQDCIYIAESLERG